MIEGVFVDPNLIYLALLAGLWLTVTAVYLVGTGLIELGAGALLIGTFIALGSLPTNWTALILVVIGVSGFLLMPFISTRLAHFADLGLVLQVVGSFTLFDGLSVSPLLIMVTVGMAWGYHRLILLPILRSQRKRSPFEQMNEVIGARGRVVKALDPVGTVQVLDELWTARSQDSLPSGVEIVVVDQKGLELIVEKAKRGESSEPYFHTNGVASHE